MHFLSRALAGESLDKLWAVVIGNRNSGKSLIDIFLKLTFGEYVKPVSSNNLVKQSKFGVQDEGRKNYWYTDFEYVRLAISLELDYDKKDVFDGNIIKRTFGSGGDQVEVRRLFKDSRFITSDSTLIVLCNDFPTVVPADALETCIKFNSTVQFVTKEHIEQRKKDGASKFELSQYRVGDDRIKEEYIRTVKWMDSLIHIIVDSYKTTKVPRDRITTVDESPLLVVMISRYFEITKYEKDRITNKEIDQWIDDYNISASSLKVKQQLIAAGAIQFNIKGKRGLKCIKLRTVENDDEPDNNDITDDYITDNNTKKEDIELYDPNVESDKTDNDIDNTDLDDDLILSFD